MAGIDSINVDFVCVCVLIGFFFGWSKEKWFKTNSSLEFRTGLFGLQAVLQKKNGGSTALGFVFPNKLGKIPIFTNIFQMGWNHQLDWNDLFSHVVILVLFAFPMAYQVAYNNLALSLNRGEKVSRMPQ